jgi:hypothetical protein
MVCKELDRREPSDPLAAAGRRAEEQMAHYLRREFGSVSDVRVFHDLRLERDGDAAQIDHLVLHCHGVIILESKSVTTQVEVNDHGEWRRQYRGQWRGMASPVEQARRQGEFLRAYLQEHREALRGRILLGLRQGGFRWMPIDLVVAVSDEGIIRRPKRLELPEVVKADQATARVRALLKEHRRANSLFNLGSDGGYTLRGEEMQRIAEFLLAAPPPRGRCPGRGGRGASTGSGATGCGRRASTGPGATGGLVGGLRASPGSAAGAGKAVSALSLRAPHRGMGSLRLLLSLLGLRRQHADQGGVRGLRRQEEATQAGAAAVRGVRTLRDLPGLLDGRARAGRRFGKGE